MSDAAIDLVMIGVLAGVPLAYLAYQVLALVRWRGGWSLAAAVPVLGWALWALNLVVDVLRDPTSHNLLPFEIAIGAAGALVFLAALAALRSLAAWRAA